VNRAAGLTGRRRCRRLCLVPWSALAPAQGPTECGKRRRAKRTAMKFSPRQTKRNATHGPRRRRGFRLSGEGGWRAGVGLGPSRMPTGARAIDGHVWAGRCMVVKSGGCDGTTRTGTARGRRVKRGPRQHSCIFAGSPASKSCAIVLTGAGRAHRRPEAERDGPSARPRRASTRHGASGCRKIEGDRKQRRGERLPARQPEGRASAIHA